MLSTCMGKYLRVDFLFRNACVPLALLAVYCASFTYLAPLLIPASVNLVFASRLGKCLLPVLALAAVVMSGVAIFRREGLRLKGRGEKISAGDLLLLLLPLTPVVQYIINNQESLSRLDALIVLVFFGLFSGFYILVIPVLLGRFGSTRILRGMSLAFVYTLISMAMLSSSFSWLEYGSMKVQLPYFVAVLAAAMLLLSLKGKRLLSLLIVANLLINSGVQVLSAGGEAGGTSDTGAEDRLGALVAGRSPATTANIYLMIYDSYVTNETMLAYGIDNQAQEDYLSEQGFVLYPHTYSVGAETIDSMSRVLNATSENLGQRRRTVAGDGAVHQALKSLGYTTYGIFPYDYMFRGVGSFYDVSVPQVNTPPYMHLITGVLMGEFRFDIGFEAQSYDQYAETKLNLLAGITEAPVFIYAHSALPGHSQNSGVCLANETALYAERLASANREMRQDIEMILRNDPGALIIVAGDHGPYLTKNCTVTDKAYEISEISRLDIQDRYGAFLAIRWPTEGYAQYDQIQVLQDVFPAVLAYLYDDQGILQLIVEPVIENTRPTSGVTVTNGVIAGGMDDGEALFLSGR